MIDKGEDNWILFVLGFAALVFGLYPLVKDSFETGLNYKIILTTIIISLFLTLAAMFCYQKILKHKVDDINPKISALEKNVCSKIEANGEIMSKDKKSFNFGFAFFLSVTIFLFNRVIDFVEFEEKDSKLISNFSVKLIILVIIFVLWVIVCMLTFPQEFKEFKELILGKIKA